MNLDTTRLKKRKNPQLFHNDCIVCNKSFVAKCNRKTCSDECQAERRKLAKVPEIPNATTHGHASNGTTSKTYSCWYSIIQRCTNPNTTHYNCYGGRGISVCERWKKFENFLDDMGECPSGKQIDRINNDGNYEPGNCKWATRKEQCRNTRQNHLLTFNGETHCVTEWAEIKSISVGTLRSRVSRNWSIERALMTP